MTEDWRLVMAKAALAQHDPAQVQRLASSIKEDLDCPSDARAVANLLLAVALLQRGDTAEAARAWADAGARFAQPSHTRLTDYQQLTSRELEVLGHMCDGSLTLEGIARTMFLSRNTVKSHVSAVFKKLDVDSRPKAIEVARELGLIPPHVSAHARFIQVQLGFRWPA